MIQFTKGPKYKKTKFLGLYKIRSCDSMYLLYLCDNNQILVIGPPSEPLVFINQEFADEYLIRLPTNNLLEILYAI